MRETAVITGAGSGVGQALVYELVLRHNMEVLAIGRRLNKLIETQSKDKAHIRVVQADVSTAAGREKISGALKSTERIRFLVHNAAVLEPVIPLSAVTPEQWRKHQRINVEGPLFLTQRLLPKLKGGRILHISSGAAHSPYAGWGAYCTSKAALHMIYRVLKEELNDSEIAVGSVRPGVVDTPMQDRVRQADRAIFPKLDKFIQLKESHRLYSSAQVAGFLSHILLNTSAEKFSEKEWDIREDWTIELK